MTANAFEHQLKTNPRYRKNEMMNNTQTPPSRLSPPPPPRATRHCMSVLSAPPTEKTYRSSGEKRARITWLECALARANALRGPPIGQRYNRSTPWSSPVQIRSPADERATALKKWPGTAPVMRPDTVQPKGSDCDACWRCRMTKLTK
jgi:hypothetical protein